MKLSDDEMLKRWRKYEWFALSVQELRGHLTEKEKSLLEDFARSYVVRHNFSWPTGEWPDSKELRWDAMR